MRRGDLAAWLLPDVARGDTGHVFVVSADPVVLEDGTLSVSVYDASDVLHFDDSRGPGPGQFRTGVGSGVIHFQIDANGAPTAFQFNADETFTTVPIAIGRIEPFSAE